jgi:large repetitive protein
MLRPRGWKLALVTLLALMPMLLSGCAFKQLLDGIVNEAPHAVILASAEEGRVPLEVSFDAVRSLDDGTIMEYRWNFGDPSDPTSTHTPQATHTYTQPGTYLVRLTVVDDKGAVGSQQMAVVVHRALPVATASVSDLSPYPGDPVTFNAEGSYDLQGQIISYEWYFGDGGTASGKSVEHTYVEGDHTYLVTLIVTNDAGETARSQLTIEVLPGSSRCGSGANDSCGGTQKPLAIITSSHFSCGTEGRVGDTITLDGSASRPVKGSIVTFEWDFGDGNTATGPIVSHVYTKAWSYIVTLKIIDEGGNVGTAIAPLSIGGAASTCD